MSSVEMNLYPYPDYKPSGIDWLGEVPAHWDVKRLSRLGDFSKGSGGTKDDEVPQGIPCVRYGDLYTFHKYFVNQTRSFIAPDNTESYTPIQHGDVLFTTSDVSPRNVGKSATILMTSMAYCGPDLVILRPTTPTKPKFMGYLLDSIPAQAQKAQAQRGVTIMHIYATQLKNLTFGIPPICEQTAIVRYLDRDDERIQRAISTKERLIELLTEQRQAVIHRAVTRGLDPNVRLKDSGVEWLGDVPEHWDVRRLRTLAHISTGGKDTINRVDDGKYPFFVRSQTVENIDTWSFDGEAVLTAGDGVGVGRVFHYVNGKFDYHQRVYKFSDFRDIQGGFFYHYLATMLPFEVRLGTAKSTGDSLRLPMLQNLPVAIAPISEQIAIVRHLDKATADIDTAIDKAQRQIDLLREYRTRLVADVVTGQVDVRGAVEDEIGLPVS